MSSKISFLLVLSAVFLLAVAHVGAVSLIPSALNVYAAFNNGSATFSVSPALVGAQISSLTIVAKPGPPGQALCCQTNTSTTPPSSNCDPTNVWGCYGPKGANVFEVLLVGPNLDYNDATTRLFPPPSYNNAPGNPALHFVTAYDCPNYEFPLQPPSYSVSYPQNFAYDTTITITYNPPVTLTNNYTFIHSENYNNKTGTACSQSDNFGYTTILAVDATLATSPSMSGVAASISGSTAVSISGSPAVSISGSPAVSISGSPAVSISGSTAASIAGSVSNSLAGSVSNSLAGSVSASIAISPTPAASQSINNSPAGPQCVRCYNNCGSLLRRFRDVCTLQLFGNVTVVNNAVTPLRHDHRPGFPEFRRLPTKGTRTICCNNVAQTRISSPNFSWNSPVVCPLRKREKLLDLCALFGGNATCFPLPTAAANFGASYYRCLPKA